MSKEWGLPWEISCCESLWLAVPTCAFKGCGKIALAPVIRAAWLEAMQIAHERALLSALPWQLEGVTAERRLVRSEVDWMLVLLQWVPHCSPHSWAGTAPGMVSCAQQSQTNAGPAVAHPMPSIPASLPAAFMGHRTEENLP